MNQFKRAKVLMFSTGESNLSINRSYKEGGIGVTVGKPYLTYCRTFKYYSSVTDKSCNPQHIYIILDDEVKEVEENIWYYDSNFTAITKYKGESNTYVIKYFKKLIATTDTSLKLESEINNYYKNSIDIVITYPKPSFQFIEKYIKEYNKGNIITEVLVEYITEYIDNGTFSIINNPITTKPILKINSKDNTITIKKIEKTLKDIMKKNPNIRKEVEQLIINCCGEVSCEDGTLIGKSPEELVQWIKQNL